MSINKKGQLGETITWVVATIIIIFVLITSIYASSLVAKSKKVLSYDSYEREADGIMTKMILSYFLTNGNGQADILFKLQNDVFYGNAFAELNKIRNNLK